MCHVANYVKKRHQPQNWMYITCHNAIKKDRATATVNMHTNWLSLVIWFLRYVDGQTCADCLSRTAEKKHNTVKQSILSKKSK